MSRGRTIALRSGAILAGILVAALLAEGAVSLLFRRSLLRGKRDGRRPFRMRMLDEERLAAGALTPGPYAVDTDPYVAMRLKGNHARRTSIAWPTPTSPACASAFHVRERPRTASGS